MKKQNFFAWAALFLGIIVFLSMPWISHLQLVLPIVYTIIGAAVVLNINDKNFVKPVYCLLALMVLLPLMPIAWSLIWGNATLFEVLDNVRQASGRMPFDWFGYGSLATVSLVIPFFLSLAWKQWDVENWKLT